MKPFGFARPVVPFATAAIEFTKSILIGLISQITFNYFIVAVAPSNFVGTTVIAS